MDRDFIGYGTNLPKVVWPDKAQIAVNFVLNYEEGSERNVLDGDGQSEDYLVDWPKLESIKNDRCLSSESLFEYGSRVGVWRLLSIFETYHIPITVFATGLALERNPPLAEWLKKSPHEIAGHGYRWINYRHVNLQTERADIKKTIGTIENLTGKKVVGWYSGRGSINARKLIIEAGLKYDSDSYADDLPYWMSVKDKRHLIIPYSLDTNDARYATSPGWNTADDFLKYLIDSFDYLFYEGKKTPKMMTIGLHPRFSGRPGRCRALIDFIKYINEFKNVWICRREDIANYWYENHL